MRVREDCMDKLEALGFSKGRVYYTKGLVKVHMTDRRVFISFPGHYGMMSIPEGLAELIANLYLETPTDSTL